MSRRRIASVLGGAAGAVLLGFACDSGSPSAGTTPSPARTIASAAPSARAESVLGAVPPSVAWKVGTQRTYALDFSSKAAVQTTEFMDLRWKGKLVVTVVEASPRGTTLHVAPADTELTTRLDALRSGLDQIEKELATAFAVELDAQGVLARLRFTDEPSSLAVGQRQSLAATLQATRRGADPTWVRAEQDGTGRYDARYDTTERPLELRKRKLRYSNIRSASSDPDRRGGLTPKVVKSEEVIRLDTGGALDSVEATEELSAETEQILPIRSSAHIELRTLAAGAVGASDLERLARASSAAERRELGANGVARDDTPQTDGARIAGRTLDQVLTGLRATEPGKGRESEPVPDAVAAERASLFGALIALVRRQPETVPMLVRLIDKGDSLSTTFIDALGYGGSPEAQKALSAMLAKKALPPDDLGTVAVTLSQTPHPTEEATQRLVSLLDEKGLRIQAFYGLGTHARVVREAGDEQRASRILKIILDRLQASKDSVIQVTALRAVANSANETALPVVRTFLRAEHETVRGAAVESLHGMRHPDVDAILAQSLASDPGVWVRRSAVRAMGRREPNETLEAPTRAAVRSEKDPNLRLEALHTLVTWLPSRPELASTLRAVADHDEKQSIREEARSALGEGKERKP